MPAIKVKTQAELDAALETITDDDWIVCEGDGHFTFRDFHGLVHVEGDDAPTMVACDASKPAMVARGSSKPRMFALDASEPTMLARESSKPRMDAWDDSKPTMVAWESSEPTMAARESSEPTMFALGTSEPTMVALGTSKPTMFARESSKPTMFARGGLVTGTVGKYATCTVVDCGGKFDIPGAVVISEAEYAKVAQKENA